MINILRNFSLKKRNTFGLDVIASNYVNLDTIEDLIKYIQKGLPEPHLIIGEGSNLLFRKNYEGTIIHPDIRGIKKIKEDASFVDIEAFCGENWDSFVAYCCEQNYAGLENLSLIPGSLGSAPVQNIGAYGVEIKDRILWVEGIYTDSGRKDKIYNEDCNFGYRSSIFKRELKAKFLIYSVVFRLDKTPRFNLKYGDLENIFRNKPKQDINNLRECIVEIRKSKLPDPAKTGNAGSFFKNPVIPTDQYSLLINQYPEMPSYPTGEKVKIPAAWLIEKAGWKGVRENDTGTWPKQPLVIVNYGNAKGEEIYAFSQKIQKAVKNQFNVDLEREVKVI